MKILASTGIRSEYDILYPVLKILNKNNYNIGVVVSGAHLSDTHNKTIKNIQNDNLEIVDMVDSLLSTDRPVQRSKGVGLLIQGISQTVEKYNPDMLIVVGDREESIATSIVGNYMNKLVLHIGGGDPVYGNADDPIRFAVSKLSHVHFCTSKDYAENLIKVGEEKFRVFNVGNPSYSNIDNTPRISFTTLKYSLKLDSQRYLVFIYHPLSSDLMNIELKIKTIINAFDKFCIKHNFQVVFIPPNSDPGSIEINRVINSINFNWLKKLKTLPRLEFINLIRFSSALVGNSSMGILEAPHYKLPVINIGKRQSGRLNAGNVNFVSHNEKEIYSAINLAVFNKSYIEKVKKIKNPYGTGDAPKKILNVIKNIDINDKKWTIKKKFC